MPFSLTNALAAFQALMNDIIRPFLCRFVLVLFDDILVYSSSWLEHLHHLHAVFQVLRQQILFLVGLNTWCSQHRVGASVDSALRGRNAFLQDVRGHILQAQQYARVI